MATSGGVFLALSPWAVVGGAVIFFAVALPTRTASLGSLATAALLPLLVYLLPHRGDGRVLVFTVLLSVFVIWAHRSNIRRLARGEENRFGEARSRRPEVPSERDAFAESVEPEGRPVEEPHSEGGWS